jgi:predicted helicase
VSLFEKPISWDNPIIDLNIISIFDVFFGKIGYRAISDALLVRELSSRARLLVKDIMELIELTEDEAENEIEARTIRSLHTLWITAASSHDKSLGDNKVFAGFIAQILSFGLLYAHRCLSRFQMEPNEKYVKLHSFWNDVAFSEFTEFVKPFQNLFHALNDELESKLSKIGGWYDNTRRLLSHIKLTKSQVSALNFHEQYEAFLAEFDKDTRIDFGAWYTPTIIADFMVSLVNFTMGTDDNLKSLVDRPYNIIDPCCGTGTFIESILNNLPLTSNSKITGFEILPVPYALASYRLFQNINENVNNVIPEIKLILTNTLGDNTFEKPTINPATDSLSQFFAKELYESYKYACCPLTIIIGNPPCSDSGVTNAGLIIDKLMEDFRPTIRRSRQNVQQQLSNEWIKFLRWALYKAENSKPSIFAMILPSAFGKNVSFKFARKYILEHCSSIQVIEFDSDNRNSAQNKNIFNTLQGRLIVLGALTDAKPSAFIKYVNIEKLSIAEKREFLSKPITSILWDVVPINEEFQFTPTCDIDIQLYSQFWHLTSESENDAIFLRHCSGLKLSPTHLLVHLSKGQLSRRSRYIADMSNTYTDIKDRWYNGQQKPPRESKLSAKVRKALQNVSGSICCYSYRPFLSAYVISDANLLSALCETPGGGMRFRPEVQAAYEDPRVFGFAVAPAPAEISTEITKFCSFCWFIPDNDITARGNGHVFCNYFPEYKNKKNWEKDVKTNVNTELISRLSSIWNKPAEQLHNEIIFYSYAILSSNAFLNRFRGKLHTVAGEYPAIPITANQRFFDEIACIGEELANLEKEDYAFSCDEMDSLIQITISADGWNLVDYSIHTDKSTVELVKDNGETVCLSLPHEVITYSVSGYNIIREWFKYHKYAYYRRHIDSNDVKSLESLVNRILLSLKKSRKVDSLIDQILQQPLVTPISSQE